MAQMVRGVIFDIDAVLEHQGEAYSLAIDTIQEENYVLRPQYSERKSVETGVRIRLSTLSPLICNKDFCFRNLLHNAAVLPSLLERIRDLNPMLISVSFCSLSTQDRDKENP